MIFLEKTSENTYKVRLNNGIIDRTTNTPIYTTLITAKIHNQAGLFHLKNWIEWQNNLAKHQNENKYLHEAWETKQTGMSEHDKRSSER